jgi:thiamine-monophosphate kinase
MKTIPFEFEFHQWLAAHCPQVTGGIGVGDDAAVVPWAFDQLVMTTDTLCDGIHFLSTAQPWTLIGRKALAVSLSDIAAMGAIPVSATVHLVLPRTATPTQTHELMMGMLDLAREHQVSIVGGDTNRWGESLVVGVTVVGYLHDQPWRMDGAQVGDVLLVTGPLGGSILDKHLTFTPRCHLVNELAGELTVHAATDISDSLMVDLDALLSASGHGAEIDLTVVPISAAAQECATQSARTPLAHALYDGEDFELILSVPATEWETYRLAHSHSPLVKIGTVIEEPTIWGIDADRQRKVVPVMGFEH